MLEFFNVVIYILQHADNSFLLNGYTATSLFIFFVLSKYLQMKTGDVSSRRQIRQENNCKPFKYFLDHVREIIHLYVPENLRASGAVSTKPFYPRYSLTNVTNR